MSNDLTTLADGADLARDGRRPGVELLDRPKPRWNWTSMAFWMLRPAGLKTRNDRTTSRPVAPAKTGWSEGRSSQSKAAGRTVSSAALLRDGIEPGEQVRRRARSRGSQGVPAIVPSWPSREAHSGQPARWASTAAFRGGELALEIGRKQLFHPCAGHACLPVSP